MTTVSDATFRSLATGGGGATAAAELYGLQIRRRLSLLRGVMEETRLSNHPQADLVTAAYETISELAAEFPEVVAKVIRHPPVTAWAWTVYQSARSHGSFDPRRMGAIAVAATVAAGASRHVKVVMDDDGTLMLPSLGLLTPAGTATEIDVDGTRLSASDWSADLDLSADGPGWRVLHRIELADGFEVILDDLDPHRWSETGEVAPRLDEQAAADWGVQLRGAWKVLKARHPVVSAEVETIISAIAPIRSQGSGVASASSRQSFGTIAMSTPGGRPAWLAETLAHEIQHAKLDALMQLVPLIRYERTDRYYAPWRPDPRPAHGLLQGAYAYLGVVEFWRREHPFEGRLGRVEFARWREAVEDVTDTLMKEHVLTEAGTTFVDGMRTRLEELLADPLDDESVKAARKAADSHRADWVARNGASDR
ncbi:aKG-HExxH-type peptide beta-hydroxylase [Herbidospora sp. RD11066]